jgi:hypothetical protein
VTEPAITQTRRDGNDAMLGERGLRQADRRTQAALAAINAEDTLTANTEPLDDGLPDAQ